MTITEKEVRHEIRRAKAIIRKVYSGKRVTFGAWEIRTGAQFATIALPYTCPVTDRRETYTIAC